MAIEVKPLGESAQLWSSRAAGSSTLYAERAQGAAQRYVSNAAAGAQNFHQAVSASGVLERYRRGVQTKGANKYARRIAAVGQSRYSAGVGVAQDDWQQGFAPFAQTISALTLQARRPRGDPGNYQRVQQVGQALHARRLAMLGAGS